LKKLESIKWRERGASISQLNGSGSNNEGSFGKVASEYDIVKGNFWFVKGRESFGVLGPRKTSAVNYGSAQSRAMSAYELGKGVDNHIGAIAKRLEHQRCRNGVIHYEGNTFAVRYSRNRFEIDDIACRIANRLDKNAACPLIDQSSYRPGFVVLGKARFDSEGRKNVSKIRVRRPVQLRRDDKV
jgi:hypothetical protein